MSYRFKIETAVDRVEHGKRLIQEALLARMQTQGASLVSEDEIERTRRVGEAMGNLALLIEGMSDAQESPSRR